MLLAAMSLAVCWSFAGSVVAAVALWAIGWGLLWGMVWGLRANGIDRSHPLMLRARARVWRDATGTLRAALRRADVVFVAGPTGQVYAPSAVEVVLAPRILQELLEQMDAEVLAEFATHAYAQLVKDYGAIMRGSPFATVAVVSSANVPVGGFVVRKRGAEDTRSPRATTDEGHHDGRTRLVEAPPSDPPGVAPAPSRPPAVVVPGPGPVADLPTSYFGDVTMTEEAVVTAELGLQTDGSWCATLLSPAYAGRDPRCDLPVAVTSATVSRRHAQFAFQDGTWWVRNVGLNGLQLNGSDVKDDVVRVADGDRLRWGAGSRAPVSVIRVRTSAS